ncbi:hypothetical protein RA263_19300 [Pseudomonas syringae pv. tagetis]|uniref:Uncharacterized protein n=1 Tax=Pseudomonas syringae pv. tagetis TaxID=129140 RepID=A0ABW7NPY8_9PSED|nr:hypothetical protein [Pseudomonas syringae group genomosp. 7]UNB63218.1 hypothetical protein MME54_27355 [Pseudomonas syringae pv. helianthi]UNB68684.1 hypothetical protein MME58_26660 [Pseudomonas syringae pv. tagetis]
MANYEVRLSTAEFEGDATPEVLVEFWDANLLNERTGRKGDYAFTAFVTATVTIPSRVKQTLTGVEGIDDKDDAILIDLAKAFVKMNLFIK